MDTERKAILLMSESPHAVDLKNQLLASLLKTDHDCLLPHLHQIELVQGDVIYSAGDNIETIYFPETAVVALLSTLEDGSTTEVGLIGREGMVGLSVFLGGAVTPERAVVQINGSALKMSAASLAQALRRGSALQVQLLRYTRSFLALVTQSVICSQHHSLEARFARWLLMMRDYSGSTTLQLTHEMVAGMIGTRRAGVSMATRALRERGLIESARGMIEIVNGLALEGAACECYAIIRDEFAQLHESQLSSRPLNSNAK
jgi:CRP-like cAMP-binding protein